MRLAALLLAGFVGGAACGFVLVQRTGWTLWRPTGPVMPVWKNTRAVFFDNDPRYLWKPQIAPLRRSGMGVNEDGFRDPLEFDEKLRAREGRSVIVLLGSSGGFGTMLNDRDTIGPVLERALARRGMRALVFNLSQPGYSSTQGRVLFDDWAGRLHPDLVITLLGYVEGSRSGAEDAVLMTEPRWYNTFRRSRLREWLHKAGLIKGTIARRVPVERYVADLRAIGATARAHGARRTLIVPAVDAWKSEQRREYNAAAAAAAAFPKGGDPEALHFQDMARRDLFQDDGAHLNAAGVRKTVAALLPHISASLGRPTSAILKP